MNVRGLRVWYPAILWICVIFAVSSIPTVPPLRIVFRFSDKIGHVLEYCVLGIALAAGFTRAPVESRRRRAFLFVVLTGLGIGMADEIYQISVPGRTGEFLDWVADGVGVTLGYLIAGWRRRRAAGRA